jgi:hypothetical protein
VYLYLAVKKKILVYVNDTIPYLFSSNELLALAFFSTNAVGISTWYGGKMTWRAACMWVLARKITAVENVEERERKKGAARSGW